MWMVGQVVTTMDKFRPTETTGEAYVILQVTVRGHLICKCIHHFDNSVVGTKFVFNADDKYVVPSVIKWGRYV